MTNSQFIHNFFNGNEYKETRHGNLFTDGKGALYSYGYHFQLATFETAKNGTKWLFINSSSYSNSTAKHQNSVRSAYNYNLVKPEHVLHFPFANGYVNGNLQNNIDLLFNEAKENFNKQLTARSNSHYYSAGSNLLCNAQNLIANFGGIAPENITALRNLAFEKYQTIEAKNQIKRLEEERINELELSEKLELWRKFEFKGYLNNSLAYLRINGEDLETSKGVKVPLFKAKMLLELIRDGKNVIGERIGNFRIDEITTDYIRIGCHKIEFKEINSLGL